jgi:fluoride exporter
VGESPWGFDSLQPHLIGLDRRQLTAVFAGGCAGAVLRYGLSEALPAAPGAWPWATLMANLAGAFAIGWAVVRLPAASARAHLLGPGLCGALTTFSTLQLELLRMLDRDELGLAAAYATVSIAAGLAAVLAGSATARRAGAGERV